MKELALHDRPREKMEREGVSALGDNELLAVLIGHGTAAAGALAMANHLLTVARGIHGLARMHTAEMADVPGIGAAVTARIMAAIELGRRTLVQSPMTRPQLATPREVANFLLPQFGAHPLERFGVLLLDARYRVIRVKLLSLGTRDSSLVHPREVFREATLALASAIVVFHNHPTGDPTPSADDVALTRRLVNAGRLMGIEVVDHLILADNCYCSLKESRRIR